MKLKIYKPKGHFSVIPPAGYKIENYNQVLGRIIGKITPITNIKKRKR